MIDALQWTAIIILAALLWLRLREPARSESPEPPDPRLEELREVEERLALLLHAVREDLARDLAALEQLRASEHPVQMQDRLPPAQHPFEYKRVAPGPGTPEHPFEYKRVAPVSSSPEHPFENKGVAPVAAPAEHPFEYKRVAPGGRREWTREETEVLELLREGYDPDAVARRVKKSPHEVRLLARLAAGTQKPA